MITDERLAAWERLAGIQNPDWPDAYQAQHALRALLPVFRQLRAECRRLEDEVVDLRNEILYAGD